jgi:hypothetical protein
LRYKVLISMALCLIKRYWAEPVNGLKSQ